MSRLKRALGTADATWMVVGNMVGAGIFVLPGTVAGHLPGGAWMLAAWALGGLLALAGAAVYAELGARHPDAGGDYRYLFSAFGALPAFLSGWSAFLLTFSAAAAAMAMTAVGYLDQALPVSLGHPAVARVLGVALIIGLTAANAAGSRIAGRTTILFTALPLVGLALLFAWALFRDSPALHWPVEPFRAPGGAWPLALGAALVPVFFAYSGWNAAAYVASEIRDTERRLPRALLAGTGLVTAVYLAVNGVLLVTLHPGELAGSTTAVADAARRLLGAGSDRLLAAVIAVAILGSVNVTLMAGARIYYAMARDHLAPAALGRVSASGVPGASLWSAGVWSALLVAVGSFELLVSWSTLAILLVSSLAVAGLFIERRRRGDAPFRCPGYPVTPVLYLVAVLGVLVSSIDYDPWGTLGGAAIIVAGIPAYRLMRRFGAGHPAGDGGATSSPS